MAEGAPIRLSKALRELNVGMNSVVDFLDTKGISIDARPNTKLDVDTYGLLVEEFAPDRAKKQKSEALADQVVVRETITLADQKKSKIDKKQDQDEILIKNVGGFTEVEVIAPEPVVEEKPAESEKKEEPTTEAPKETPKETTPPAPKSGPTVVGTIDLSTVKSNRPTKKEEPKATEKPVTKPAKATAEKPADTAAKEVQKAEEAEKPKETKEVKEVKETKEEIPVAPVSTKPEFIETKVKKLDGPKFVGKIDLPPPTVKPAKKVGESA
ncbi:MAG: translation initiation factor IF-2, partial [Flavobacteriales bacterium]|nr:translation initiation factor IF-2 [Flavobacteriales bacterium]